MPRCASLLILDCDGVLIRSEGANLAYYNHLFGVFGLPLVEEGDRERLRLLHTLSTPQVVDVFFPEDLRAKVLSYAAGVNYEPFEAFLEPEPGWDSVLPRLRGVMPVAVATNRGMSAHSVLESVGLRQHIDLVVTVRDVERPKPHPDVLFAVLRHFGVDAGEALYVGDSSLDREASQKAGIPFLGFRDGFPGAAASPRDVELHACPLP